MPNISCEDQEVEKLKYIERRSILVMTSIFLAWVDNGLIVQVIKRKGKIFGLYPGYIDGNPFT